MCFAMKKIGELLVEQGKISERDVERTLLAQTEMGGMFGQVLVKLGLVSEQDVAVVLGEQLSIPLMLAADYPESPIVVEGIAQDFLINNGVVPVEVTDTAVKFARTQTWYAPSGSLVSFGRALSIRMGLNLAGLVLILAAMVGYGPTWLWTFISLACLGTGEVVGRQRFYKAYRRLGL